MVCLPVAAAAGTPDFSINRNANSVAVLGGVVGFKTAQQSPGIGFNVTLLGLSVDYITYGPKYAHEEEERLWDDKKAFSVNIGYQIPLLRFLSIYPIAGYSETSTGVTDGTKYRYDYDTDTFTLTRVNKYTKTWTGRHFNYGGGIAIKPFKWLTIHMAATRYAIYGGIGMNLALDR